MIAEGGFMNMHKKGAAKLGHENNAKQNI